MFDKTEQEEELNTPEASSPGTTYLPTLQTEEPARHLIVEIQHMPTGPQFDNFLRIIKKLKGSSTVELMTPDGSLELQGTTGIDPTNAKHVNVVSLALGGAKVRYAAQDVDLAALAEDIAF